jgi:hypothetical protein
MGTATVKGGNILIHPILRFYNNHMLTSLTFWKIYFSIYNLLIKKALKFKKRFQNSFFYFFYKNIA